MGSRQIDPNPHSRFASHALLLGLISCGLVYTVLSTLGNPDINSKASSSEMAGGNSGAGGAECCRGIENLELWGSAVKWGSEFKFNSSVECCKACRAMCSGSDRPCLCYTWVFLWEQGGLYRSKYGECNCIMKCSKNVGSNIQLLFGNASLFVMAEETKGQVGS